MARPYCRQTCGHYDIFWYRLPYPKYNYGTDIFGLGKCIAGLDCQHICCPKRSVNHGNNRVICGSCFQHTGWSRNRVCYSELYRTGEDYPCTSRQSTSRWIPLLCVERLLDDCERSLLWERCNPKEVRLRGDGFLLHLRRRVNNDLSLCRKAVMLNRPLEERLASAQEVPNPPRCRRESLERLERENGTSRVLNPFDAYRRSRQSELYINPACLPCTWPRFYVSMMAALQCRAKQERLSPVGRIVSHPTWRHHQN
jgi:hypothetical protein